jgi:hypothetical protein
MGVVLLILDISKFTDPSKSLPTPPYTILIDVVVEFEAEIVKGNAGLEVPIPRLPLAVTRRSDDPEEDAMSNKAKVGELDVPTMFTSALLGAVVPIAIWPSSRIAKIVVVAVLSTVKAFVV